MSLKTSIASVRINQGSGAPTGQFLVGLYEDISTSPSTLYFNGRQVQLSAATTVTPPVSSAPAFTTHPTILLQNAASLISADFETNPSWTATGGGVGITVQATDKPHAGTKSFKVPSGVGPGIYYTKTFTPTNLRRYSLVWYAWLASTSNGSGHLIGGFLDATAANYVSLGVNSTGNAAILTGGSATVTLSAFPRDQWVKVELAVTIDTGGLDTLELNINDVSWYSGTANASAVLMSQIEFGSDFGATTTTNLWIDDVVLNDPSSGTTSPGTSQPAGTAFKANSFVATGASSYSVQWATVTSAGVVTLRGTPVTTAPFSAPDTTTFASTNLYYDATAIGSTGLTTTERSPSISITTAGTTPNTTPPPTPTGNFADLLTYDKTGTSEALPTMSNLGYDWAFAPRSGSFPPPSTFSAYTPWGVFSTVGGVAVTARVQVASIEFNYLSKGTGAWTRTIFKSGVLNGANYPDSYSGSNAALDQVASAYGGASVKVPAPGYNFHFYADQRATMNPGDVDGLVVIIRARLEPGTYTGSPQVVLCAGGDWWLNATAPFLSDFSNNRDMGIGRFKLLGANMRMFTLSAGNLSTLPSVSYSTAEMF